MERTQPLEKKFKKFSEKMLACSHIFTPENYNYRKQKRYVSIEKEKKDNYYAGNTGRSSANDEVIYYNM